MTTTVTDTKGNVLPAKYLSRATPHDYIPPTGRLRLFFHGPVGQGKTTFGCSFPRAAILDFENKASSAKQWGEGTAAFNFQGWEEWDTLINDLVSDGQKNARCFDTVIFDTITPFIKMVRRKLTKKYQDLDKIQSWEDITSFGSQGKGWDMVNMAVGETFDRLYAAGYGWIVFAHMLSDYQEAKGGGKILTWSSVLNAGVKKYLYAECEYSGTLGSAIRTVMESQPVVVGNKKLPPKKVPREVSTYMLKFLPVDPTLPTRQHFPMAKSEIVIPHTQGYQAFDEVYQSSSKLFRGAEPTSKQ